MHRRSPVLDPLILVFVVVLVAVVSIGRTVRAVMVESIRRRPLTDPDRTALPAPEVEELRESLGRIVERLDRLEEERDFYRDLLESPEARLVLRPPASKEKSGAN